MNEYLPFLVVGLTSGSIYALAGMGLVLTYKTSGIFNFAHGALAAVAAYVFYELWVTNGWPWLLAALVAVAGVAVVAGLGLELISRRLQYAPTSMKIVATVGLLLGLQSLMIVRYGAATIRVESFLPTSSVEVGGVFVGFDQMIVIAFVLTALAALAVFFRRSRLGLATRAVVDDEDLLGLTAVSPAGVRRRSWMIGSAFAAASGVLLAPTIGLDAAILTLLIVQAFGAAAVGRFTSVPLTYLGGLIVGVGAAFMTKLATVAPALSGLAPSFPFVVLFAVLVIGGRKWLSEVGADKEVKLAAMFRQERMSWPLAIVGVGVLAVLPPLVGARLPVFTNSLAFVIVLLSLSLLVRMSGQVSLAHMAFVALGASTFAHVAAAGAPWLFAVLAAGLVVIPVGAVIAIPAIRLSPLFLALATFGFAILMERLFYFTFLMFGRVGSLEAPRPSLFGSAVGDTAYYYLVLVFVVFAAALVWAIGTSRLGRILRGLGDSSVALDTLGTDTNTTRVIVFCIAAFLAGIAGALVAPITQSASAEAFGFVESLLLLAVLMISGPGVLAPAFVGAFAMKALPAYFTSPTWVELLPVGFGIAAVQMALLAVHLERGEGGMHLRVRSRRALSRLSGRDPVKRRAWGGGRRAIEGPPPDEAPAPSEEQVMAGTGA